MAAKGSSTNGSTPERYRRFEDFEKKFFPKAHREAKDERRDASNDMAAGALRTFRKSLPQ